MSKLNVPLLRFSEFNGQWEETKLGNLFTFKNGINATKEQYGKGSKFINVLDIINNRYITHNNIIGSVNISQDMFEKNKVEYGDILFQRSSETRDEAGQTNVYLDKEQPATFGGFVIRAKKKVDYNPEFMNNLFKTSLVRKEITTKSNGSTRYNVGQETLSNVYLYYPEIPEQTKIADFLTSVDTKIEQLTKKHKLLEEYKTGMMQKIFSQELRFHPKGTSLQAQGENDDGSEFPKWKKEKLERYLMQKSIKNKNNNLDLVLSVSNKKGFISQEEQFDGYEVASKDLSGYKIVEKNEYAYNPSRINVGSIARLISFEIGIVSPMYVTFKLTNEMRLMFFDNLYQTHKFKHLVKVGCSGSVRDSLNFNDMADFKINIPCLEEQTKIANFLSSIDTKIEQVQNQLESTKKFKKGLLQQMFI